MIEITKDFRFYDETIEIINLPKGDIKTNLIMSFKPKGIEQGLMEQGFNGTYLCEFHIKFKLVDILIIEFDCSFIYNSIMKQQHVDTIMSNINKRKLYIKQVSRLTMSEIYDNCRKIFINNHLNPKKFPKKHDVLRSLGVI